MARRLLASLSQGEGKRGLSLAADALLVLQRYAWPGNVRELANDIHRLVVSVEPETCIGAIHLGEHLFPRAANPTGTTRPLREVVRDVEAATIAARLREFGYHRAATAASLGLTREGLWHKLRQLRLVFPSRYDRPE